MATCAECRTVTQDASYCPVCQSGPLCIGCRHEHDQQCDQPLRAWLRAARHEYFVFYRPSQASAAADALLRWADDPGLTLTHHHVDAFIEAMKERLRAMP